MSWVGIPFVDGGRTREGCDCWGLVRLVHMELAGIELPDYGEISAKELVSVAVMTREARRSPVWRVVTGEPRRALDVVGMRLEGEIRRSVSHVGVMINDRKLLHVENLIDSVMIDPSHFSVAARIVDYYRHKDLP